MINKERIRIMIELARYDRRAGKKNYIINSYFASDYVGRYMIGSFVSYSFCYLLAAVISVMCNIDDVLGETDITMVIKMFKPYIVYYLAGLVIYEVLVTLVYASRFRKGQRQLKVNTARLRKLIKLQ